MRPRIRSREPLIWSKAGKFITHGKTAGYSVHGCGCDPCFDAWQNSPGHKREQAISRAASERPRTSATFIADATGETS